MKHSPDAFPEHPEHCLNCGHKTHGNYCVHCGQSTHTHRLSIWHFIMHDLVHSFWHIDRGVLFTIEEVLIRPGTAAMEYIRGKRSGRFPIVTLVLILEGMCLWLFSKTGAHGPEVQIKAPPQGENQQVLDQLSHYVGQIGAFVTHYRKWLILSLLPVGSLSSFIVFRREKMNYTEHLVLNSYVFAGALVVILYMLLFTLCLPDESSFFVELSIWLIIGLYGYAYFQAFRTYKTLGLMWRFTAFVVLNLLFILAIVMALAINWGYQLYRSGVLEAISK